jgi:hypothetical protein
MARYLSVDGIFTEGADKELGETRRHAFTLPPLYPTAVTYPTTVTCPNLPPNRLRLDGDDQR